MPELRSPASRRPLSQPTDAADVDAARDTTSDSALAPTAGQASEADAASSPDASIAATHTVSSALSDVNRMAQGQDYPAPALYIVATPIGNAADITFRARHLLGLCDRIAAEDTRNTGQLLTRYGISKPLIPAHQHNEREAAERILSYLAAGERVAFVSDAGTPGISDPGARLVDAAREHGYPIVPLPGASAAITALSAAGAWAESFTFIGFLPAKSKQRVTALQALVNHPHALVCYEAPHRIDDMLTAARDVLGGSRRVLIGRELTKLHESLHVCTLAEGPDWLAADANRRRGEFVLVIEGAAAGEEAVGLEVHDPLLRALLEELPVSAAARVAAKVTGASRNALYSRALSWNSETAEDEAEEDGDDGEEG